MLYVHRSERADRLVEILGEVLARPLADPLTAEVVAVPTRGVERWLVQRLSHRLGVTSLRQDGVCANVDFPFPGGLVRRAVGVAGGFEPDADPWPPERSVWPLLDLVDAHFDESFLMPLATHLRAASPGGDGRVRRFATVRHLADLYDSYAVHRPEMIQAWSAGAAWPDAGPSAEAAAWQAELWRRLRRRIGVASPAERLEVASRRIAADPGCVDLPPRLSLFGLTRLPASQLSVLKALAVGRDVHLFLLHPSGGLWAKLARAVPSPPARQRRADDDTADAPSNPLLRSWGRDAREMQLVLAGQGPAVGDYRPVAPTTATLLGRVQADIRADRDPAAEVAIEARTRPLFDERDDSIRIHSCHGRSRQVEVLRDAILHLLESDPTLEPRDVIIMCPDIEVFAPLIHGAFGSESGETVDGSPVPGAADGVPTLRLRLADRSLRQTNPLLGVADFLLELATGRVTASQVLDLASREPVRRRFRLDDDDLSRIEGWVAEMGVRWGLDADHRVPWGLPEVASNTWSAGLDRLLLGVTMAEEEQRLFAGTLPLDDVTSGDVELAGRLAELIARLTAAVAGLKGPGTTRAWRDALVSGTEALAAASPSDPWQGEQLHRVLDEVVLEAGGTTRPAAPVPASSPGGTQLDIAEVRSLLEPRLKGRPTRANFRTGDLTVCTLVPMRSVPHRVVCLLGLDDGVFPRHTARDGDDVLIADPYVGDRDERSEDRQLLLDAVLAAIDHLIILYSGRDERTNRRRPPAVPISELLDVVDRTVHLESGRPPRDVVVVDHPLQSFDPANFKVGTLGTTGPWSFDPLGLAGARALTGRRREVRPFLSSRLPPLDEKVIQLESLVRFVEHPVRAFLRERLGVYAGHRIDQVADSLPIDLDPLERWGVGDRLLAARLAGATAEEAQVAERARGELPPGCLADPVLADVCPTVESLVEVCSALPKFDIEPRSMEVNLPLRDGRLLVGTVPGVRDTIILRCLYSRLGPKHRLAAWVRFLALSAGRPELEVIAVTVGRGRRKWDGQQLIRMSTLPGLADDPSDRRDRALDRLGVIIDFYERGLREPLPIYCDTSAAWADACRQGGDAAEAAYSSWTSTHDFPCEDKQPEHTLVLGGIVPFDRVRRAPPRPDEAGSGWPDEPSRFGRLAVRLWDGPLSLEKWYEQ